MPGLPSNRLVRLHVDRDGGLWVITEYHDLVRLANGQCRVFAAAEGVPPAGADWVDEDAQGGLWLADPQRGLYRMQNGRFIPVLGPTGFGTGPVLKMMNDDEGHAWFLQGERLARFENGQSLVLEGPAGEPEAVVKGVCAGRDGAFWIMTPEGLRKYRRGKWLAEVWPCPDFKSFFTSAQEDLAGHVWLATYGNGLFRFSLPGTWEHFTVESGLTGSRMRCLFGDREGNLWVGTDGDGLQRIKPRVWRMVTRREGLGVDAVHSVSQDQQGRIWFAGGTTKPYWLERGLVSVAIESPLSDAMDGVFSVLPARDGSVWIGTYRGKVFRYQGGDLACFSAQEGMLAGSVRALLEDRQGAIWVGGFSGLCRILGGQVTCFSRRDGLSADKVGALAEDSKGNFFVGTSGGGLNVFQDGRFTAYTRQNGLPDDYVGALCVDAEDVLWIGTHGGGLSRFKEGRFFNYRVKGGLPARGVGPMLEDDEGRLWLASDLGIVRVSRRELNEFAEGRHRSVNYVAFDRSDGLATIEAGGIQPACLKARDGKLWFGTAKGAAFVDPKELRVNPLPPPVIIDEARIDDEVVNEQRSEVRGQESENGRPAVPRSPVGIRPPSLVTLQPRQRRVEFRFSGLSFTAPAKVRFRYQMEGFDPDWVDGGTTRSASYTRLPPGTYRFRVTACNNDGVWNETGASLGVVVAPAFHQTYWFRLLMFAAVAGVVSTVYRLRLSRLRQLARLRGRIAGDLHDEIGSNLGGIILLSELAQQATALPPDARASLQEINATAQRTACAMRDIVWFLNPDFDTLADMVARMREFATTLLSGVACEFAAPDLALTPTLTLEFRRNVFFAFKEILHNIVKHAEASRVSIRIEVRGRQFTLRVHDNGHGFDLAQATSGHGLRSLRRRAAELGGQLTAESGPGKGTTIVLTVMLP